MKKIETPPENRRFSGGFAVCIKKRSQRLPKRVFLRGHILNEVTSALDSESEVAIQKALHELMVGKTVIAIAHRLSTLREMDRIIVIADGTIIEDGTHDTLVSAGGTYARLWGHQAGGFLQEE